MTETTLSGRVALITGAAGGIGRATAARFLRAGARVALLDLDAGRLEAVVAEDALDPPRILVIAADITEEAACAEAVARTLDAFGTLDILVNNAAAITPPFPIAETPTAEWSRALDANLTGAFLMARAALAPMRAQCRGVVISIASQLGHVGQKDRGTYGVTKAALIALSRHIAIDHAQEGIRAVSISPGAVMTGRILPRFGSEEATDAALGPAHLLNRVGRPEEIAAAIVFAASDEASFLTGTDMLVDGGYTAR
ncbi:SDR family NAD(P)-dependent oxidoreductase [Roseomonas sp. CCTCC AB2023176]|uniref:SDR family NAD(P)-dependent oxidoreductase n=1 Tax=Roseomonas sp. CCTCC AB2023176 TaxID=3342640 RepID=UPI0035D60033